MERTVLTVILAVLLTGGGIVGINAWINSKVQDKIDVYENEIKDKARELESRTSDINYQIVPQLTERITETRVIQEGNARTIQDERIVSNVQLTQGFVHSYNQIILGKPIDIQQAQNITLSPFTFTDLLQNNVKNSQTRLENEANHNALIDWIEKTHEAQRDINNK